jgi:nitroreductase
LFEGRINVEVLEAIKTRRSIRHYKTDPVDDTALQMILEAARWAPSWANTQCWRFIVVRDSSIKAELAKIVHRFKRDDEMVESAAARAIAQTPVVIVACAELGKSGLHPDGTSATDKGDWFMFDVGLAVQNMVLAAHALGLGTVIMGAFDAKKAAEILGVPEGFSVVVMTPLGFPDREGKAPPRKELSEIVFHDKYGQ